MLSVVRLRSFLIMLAAVTAGILVAPALSGPASAQAGSAGSQITRRIDRYVAAHVSASDFSGIVLLAKHGKPFFLKSYGYANREWQMPNASGSDFSLTPESDTRFFADTPEVTIAFPTADGVVSQLILNLGGRDRTAGRMQ